jgi:poly-gamma-glutamate synthesis protein (capsule biosynthesis protein)
MSLLATLARLAFVLMGAGGTTAARRTAAPSGTVMFAGDVIPHASVIEAFETRGAASLLAPIAPVLRAADIALVNLETPVSPSHHVPRSGVRFNVHAEFVRALADAGIDGVSVANNHAYDQGARAVGETVATLRAAGVRPAGGALAGEDPLEPVEYALAGSTLCVIAATRIHNYFSVAPRDASAPRVAAAEPFWPQHEHALLAAVRHARTHCGAVLVSLHSGAEYTTAPLARDRAFFRRVADAGADVVIGHHPHTTQPIEVYAAGHRRVPIFYSLGNLISAQGWAADAPRATSGHARPVFETDARLREGLLAVLRFEATGERLRVAEFGFVPLWTVNSDIEHRAGDGTRVETVLFPSDGAGNAVMRERYASLVARIGAAYLLPMGSLPGASRATSLSEQALRSAQAPR